MSKTGKQQKWRYEVFVQQQRYSILLHSILNISISLSDHNVLKNIKEHTIRCTVHILLLINTPAHLNHGPLIKWKLLLRGSSLAAPLGSVYMWMNGEDSMLLIYQTDIHEFSANEWAQLSGTDSMLSLKSREKLKTVSHIRY